MSARSSGLFSRLVWLLIGTICLVLLVGMFALRLTANGAAVSYSGRVLAMQVAAADTLIASGRSDGDLAAIGVNHRATPPPASNPTLPLLRHVIADMQARLPGRNVLVSGRHEPVLWVSAATPANGWLGIPFIDLRMPLVRSTVITVGLSTLLVLLIAAAYARSLTNPLKRLADAAPSVVSGAPPPELPSGAVRELVELNAALGMAAADARRSARERDVMMAAISHDLRTPLARLRLGLELTSASIDPSLREGMVADIEALDALSAQFIAFVRDGSEETSGTVDIGGLLRDLVALNDASGDRWKVDAPSQTAVQGKPLALRRALDNLIRNAMHHGEPPFQATLRNMHGELRCSIADTGPGVPESQLTRLGEPFVRGNEARSDAVGSGLGLASTRRIATQHGGRLVLRNLPLGGFEATLVLPQRSKPHKELIL